MSANARPSKKPRLTEYLEIIRNKSDLLKKARRKAILSEAEKCDILFFFIFPYAKLRYLAEMTQSWSMRYQKELKFYSEAKVL